MNKSAQMPVFELDPSQSPQTWESEWVGMPEFVQEDLSSHRKIVVHFRNDDDVAAFARLIEQTITPRQKSLWYPAAQPRRYAHLRYVDES